MNRELIVAVYLLFLGLHSVIAWANVKSGLIPDKLTFPGALIGIVIGGLVPALHDSNSAAGGLLMSILGAIIGFLTAWAVAEAGKYFFGVKRLSFSEPVPLVLQVNPPHGLLYLGETAMIWADLFYRNSDRLLVSGFVVVEEPPDMDATGSQAVFSLNKPWIAEKEIDVTSLRLVTGHVTEAAIPREAIGFGAVKLFLFCGAFLGPLNVLLCLGLTAAAAMIVGAFGYVRSMVAPTRVSNSLIDVAPCSAVASLILVAYRIWKAGLF